MPTIVTLKCKGEFDSLCCVVDPYEITVNENHEVTFKTVGTSAIIFIEDDPVVEQNPFYVPADSEVTVTVKDGTPPDRYDFTIQCGQCPNDVCGPPGPPGMIVE